MKSAKPKAKKRRAAAPKVEKGLIQGITMCLGPMLILLSVGMLIGSWILAGTIPALIYYGAAGMHWVDFKKG